MSSQRSGSASRETVELIERCRSVTADDLPDDARERAETLVLDTLGVMLGSATQTESSAIARTLAGEVYGAGESTVVGNVRRTTAPGAAFVNGTVAHGIELDDTHSGASMHPGAVVLPAALAVGETEDATGTELLEAVVAGYELMVRVGRAADPSALYERGFHPTSCCGVFGAALTAAMLQGLDREATVNAVGIAGSFAAGNLEYLAQGTLSKRIQPGVAAQAGVTATALAARGYTGPETILEGENGFLNAYASGGDIGQLHAELDDEYEYEITRTGIKPHACCRYNQTPIDAALLLQREEGIEPDDIESITVEMVEAPLDIVARPRAEKVEPATSTAAQFSVHYSVAVALVQGRAFLKEFDEPYLTDDAVLNLAGRVTVEHAQDLEEYYPDYFPARMTIETVDGTTHERMLQTCRGDPENPLTDEEIREKYDALSTRFLPDGDAEALAEVVRDLTAVGDVGEIARYLRE